MGLSVCPIAVVSAPVVVVWANLVQWERYSEWADVQVERIEPEGAATPARPSPSVARPSAAPCASPSRSKRSNPKNTSPTCMSFFHWACNRSPTLPATPLMRPAAASHMAENSSSHQAGGVGFSKHLARKQSPPAAKSPCSASRAPLKDSIGQRGHAA